MTVSIAVHVFGDVGFELDGVDDIPAGLREYAGRATDHLLAAARVADALAADGWNLRLSRNYLEATHPAVATAGEARERVGRLGLAGGVADIGVFDDRGQRQTRHH